MLSTKPLVRSVKDDVDDPTGDFKKIYQMLSTKPLAAIAKPALSLASFEAVLLSSATALIKATPRRKGPVCHLPGENEKARKIKNVSANSRCRAVIACFGLRIHGRFSNLTIAIQTASF